MAESVTTLADQVRSALSSLEEGRRRGDDEGTKTHVLTLVIVGRTRAAMEQAHTAVHELGDRHPARVLLLSLSEDFEIGEPGFEEIALTVSGPVVGHLDSLVEPFTISDLPVVVWFVEDVPEPGDPLLDAADVLLVDARTLGGVECFPRLIQLCRRRPVVDLSWVRLQPWRELLAGLFEGPAFRPFLRSIVRAEVAGKPGPRHLLGGWLADRLDLPGQALHLEAAEHVSVRLFADDRAGRTARFEVARRGDERVVHALASVDGGPKSAALVRLPEATPAWGLSDAVSRLEHDPVYEHALRRALP